MKQRILIADSQQSFVTTLANNLVHEGFEVMTAMNGKIAIEMAKTEKPDLILLDVMLPEYNGIEVCEILRNESELKDTLIVFLTARDEDFTQIACYEYGGDDFIVKSISSKVLISKIKARLKRRLLATEIPTNKTITVDDIRMNVEEFSVYKQEKRIDFPKKEFEILLLLISKPNKLFTREEIFKGVWRADAFNGGRTIDVHIRKIREKLGDGYIKTIKGMGYKIATNTM
jgi:two-component system, OmpR family, alkaline phosphatase synthesis response regulator PhoP